MEKCLDFFPGVDRTVAGYEGLLAAQECLPDNDTRDGFAAAYSHLSRHWEALAPDPVLAPYRQDYIWLTGVYESVQPPGGQGKLLWHALGAKTVELIHENVHVEVVRDDLDTLVMDADVLEDMLGGPAPGEKGEGARNQAHPALQEACRRPALRRARGAAGEAARAPRTGRCC